MTASDARALVKRVTDKTDAARTARLENAMSKIFRDIKARAKDGGTSILFAPEVEYQAERDICRRDLEALGYSFSEESDNGLRYMLIHW